MNELLANSVLVLHAGIALFIVGGLVLVIVGNFSNWAWVNNCWFRIAHVFAIGIVVAESLLGLTCPLTTLEMRLRSGSGSGTYLGGFVEYWLNQLLYYDAPPWVFTLAYSLFGFSVLIAWRRFPPRLKPRPD